AARRRGAQAMITLDGDGQHDAASIPQLLAAAQLVERTIIVGSRLDGPGTLPSARRNAVRLASFFAIWTCGLPMRDTQSGFRVYPVALFDEVRTRRGGFVFETEILLAAAGRWAREGQLSANDVLGVFDSHRMTSRHTEMLEAAVAYSDSPVRWSTAFVAAAGRRAVARLGATWQATRKRGAVTAARGTLAAPVALPLLLLQAMAGRHAPDLLTPLINVVYGDGRAAAGAGDVDVRMSLGSEPLPEGP